MRIDAPPSDDVATRWRQRHAPNPRQHRSGEQNRRANFLAQRRIERPRLACARVHLDGVRSLPLDRRADVLQQLQHGLDVANARNVVDATGTVGEQRRRESRKGRVVVPAVAARPHQRDSSRTWLVGAALAVPVLVTTGATAWALARSVQPLGEAWGRPFPAVALILAGAATTAASWRGPKLGRRNALLDTAFGTAVVAVGVAWYHPHLALRSIVLTVIASAGLGGLFAGFVRWQNDGTDLGVGVALTGVIVAGAGFTYATQLSPFVVCALIAALGVSLAPARVRVSVQRALRRWEMPLYAAFLIIAGALLRRVTPWLLPAAILLAMLRAAVRWVTVRFGLDQMDPIRRSLPFPAPREFAFPVMRQGAAAVALAAGFDFVRGGSAGGSGGAVFLTVLLSVLAAEALVVLTPLTAAPQHAEVS